ncbi:MAG: hypothetical protein ACE5HH_00375 [Candidatus Hydrothermarchaeales archaeon]
MTKKTGKGYSYTLSEESLKRWMSMPAELKLEWLEEINRFLWKYVPKKNKEIIAKFRKGEI